MTDRPTPDRVDQALYRGLTPICEYNDGEAATTLQWVIDNTSDRDPRHKEAVEALVDLRT